MVKQHQLMVLNWNCTSRKKVTISISKSFVLCTNKMSSSIDQELQNGTEKPPSCAYVLSNLLYLDYLRSVYIANCVFNAVFSLVAVFWNTIVFVSIRRTKSLQDPSHLLLIILACTDLGVGLIEQPMYVLYKAAELNELAKISCVTGAINNVLAGLLGGMSFLTMTFISIDRFLALHLHLRYKAIVTRSLVLKVSTASFLVFSFGVFFYPWMPSVTVYFGIAIIPICLTISTILYCKIYKIFRKHQMSIHVALKQHHQETIVLKKYWKSVVGFVFVHLIMVLFYLPFAVTLGMRVVLGLTKEYKLVLNITSTLIYLNSSLNPFLYCWRIKEVRNAVGNTLVHLFRKKRSPVSQTQVNDTQTNVEYPVHVKP